MLKGFIEKPGQKSFARNEHQRLYLDKYGISFVDHVKSMKNRKSFLPYVANVLCMIRIFDCTVLYLCELAIRMCI